MSTPQERAAPTAFVARLLALSDALRRASVPVAISQDVEAVESLRHLDLLERGQLHDALAAVLVKSHAHRRTFDDLFDVFFPRGGSLEVGDLDGHTPPASQTATAVDASSDDPAPFLADLFEQLMSGEEADIRRLARIAVSRFAAARNPDGSPAWFQYRVFRAVDAVGLVEQLLRERARQVGRSPTTLERRLWRDELEARLRAFREEVDSEIRRRYAQERGPEDVARRLVRPPLEELDLFRLSPAEQAELHKLIQPLARRLATRLAAKRRHGRSGRLDVRRTVRRSLSTGGVPLDPVLRPRRPHKPELFVVCDVSGSVAAFARFTLMLVHALQERFSRVRSFAFVDTLDEVTPLFAGGDLAEAVRRMTAEADVVWFDGHSDYGHSFEVLHRRFAPDVTGRASVLVLGDARNNYRAANAWVLEDLRRRARRVYWLNPEPSGYWDTGDSIASRYAAHVDAMVEVRTLRQLAGFVERIA